MVPVQLWIEFAFEAVLIAFHTTVVVCILLQVYRGNPDFTSGFFAIYVLQSFVDVGSFVTVSELELAGALLPAESMSETLKF